MAGYGYDYGGGGHMAPHAIAAAGMPASVSRREEQWLRKRAAYMGGARQPAPQLPSAYEAPAPSGYGSAAAAGYALPASEAATSSSAAWRAPSAAASHPLASAPLPGAASASQPPSHADYGVRAGAAAGAAPGLARQGPYSPTSSFRVSHIAAIRGDDALDAVQYQRRPQQPAVLQPPPGPAGMQWQQHSASAVAGAPRALTREEAYASKRRAHEARLGGMEGGAAVYPSAHPSYPAASVRGGSIGPVPGAQQTLSGAWQSRTGSYGYGSAGGANSAAEHPHDRSLSRTVSGRGSSLSASGAAAMGSWGAPHVQPAPRAQAAASFGGAGGRSEGGASAPGHATHGANSYAAPMSGYFAAASSTSYSGLGLATASSAHAAHHPAAAAGSRRPAGGYSSISFG